MKKTLSKKTVSKALSEEYGGLIGGIAELLEASRRIAARTVNALMTATYWEIGRRIVEFEQRGKKRAAARRFYETEALRGGCALFREQPTFDRLTNIRAHFVHRVAL